MPDGLHGEGSSPLRLLFDCARASDHALALDRQGDLLPRLEPGAHFRIRPVRDPDVETPLLENAGTGVEEDTIAFAQRLRRNANDVLVRVQNDLDVGAVADQQSLRVRWIGELDFDVDRAGLLLDINHVRRNTPHTSGEAPSGQRFDGDGSRLTD